MVCDAFSYDHMLQLKVVNGTLNSQKYWDETLESEVRPSLNSLDDKNMVLQDDLNVLASSRNTKTYRTSQCFHGRA